MFASVKGTGSVTRFDPGGGEVHRPSLRGLRRERPDRDMCGSLIGGLSVARAGYGSEQVARDPWEGIERAVCGEEFDERVV